MAEITIPKKWIWTTLGEINKGKVKSVTPNRNPDQAYELYSVPSFDSKNPEIIQGKEIGSSKQTVEEKTVLLCKINPRINRVWIVKNHSSYPKIASTEWIPFQYISEILPEYLCYFMQNGAFIEFVSINVSGVGGSLMRIKASTISDYSFPLPPLPEQRAIVSKIEQLFSELDNGIANLKLAQEQLKVYRQAVLKKAFEGELTKEWRKQQVELPSAEELLEETKSERERIAKALGKKLKIVKPLTDNEQEKLSVLPKKWQWTKLGTIIEEPKYGTSKKCDYNIEGKGVLRIPNIADGSIDCSDLKFAQFDSTEEENYGLKEGDILTIRSNGSVELVGKCALVNRKDEKYLYAGYLIRLRPINVSIYSKYLLHCLSSGNLRHQIESKAKSTSGVNNINSGELQSLIIPFCSLFEQQAIVQEIETRLSVSDKLEQDISENLEKTEALRQSILKKAFEGKLLNERELEEVRNAPDWEPAEVLLERLKTKK